MHSCIWLIRSAIFKAEKIKNWQILKIIIKNLLLMDRVRYRTFHTFAAANMGHGGPRTVPQHHPELLPLGARAHPGVRRVQPAHLRLLPRVAARNSRVRQPQGAAGARRQQGG